MATVAAVKALEFISDAESPSGLGIARAPGFVVQVVTDGGARIAAAPIDVVPARRELDPIADE